MSADAQCIVFVGPTLPADEVRRLLPGAQIRPPAAQGDVYRAARGRPLAIGLVDGVFHSVPAVWHKEILWALAQGVHVFGAASMGALRAAELHAFGMVGIGRVFEAYRDGCIEADDEVALAHGPAEAGWIAVSEPLVDVRASLDAARAQGVLADAEAEALLAAARRLYYPERDWTRVLACAANAGVAAAALEALRDWLPGGRVALKRADAVEMLQTMRRLCVPGLAPFEPRFVFEDTVYWGQLQDLIDADAEPARVSDAERQVLERLRADPAAAAAAEATALGWLMADDAARCAGHEVDAAALLDASRDFCARHELADEATLQRWLADAGIGRDELLRVLARHALAQHHAATQGQRLEPVLLDLLRFSGDYGRLRALGLTPP